VPISTSSKNTKLTHLDAYQLDMNTQKIHTIQRALSNESYSPNFQSLAEKLIGFEFALNNARA